MNPPQIQLGQLEQQCLRLLHKWYTERQKDHIYNVSEVMEALAIPRKRDCELVLEKIGQTGAVTFDGVPQDLDGLDSSFKILPRVLVVWDDMNSKLKSPPPSPAIPGEIIDSLARFREVHPDPAGLGFVMMRFEKSPAHDKILAATRQTLSAFGATALRADDREFHEDLYYNILTYAFGCRFGIGVFERITSEYFNPNVSLEVGLMMGLRKPVCLLKDKTLTSLHADMVGKLYRPFDPQDPGGSIPDALTGWLKDKGIIAQSPPA